MARKKTDSTPGDAKAAQAGGGKPSAKKPSAKKAPAKKKASVKKAPVKSAARKTAAKTAAAKKTPAKKAPANKTVAKKAPAKKAPAKKAPAKKAPAKKAVAKKAPAVKKAPAQKAPATKVAAKKVSGKKAAGAKPAAAGASLKEAATPARGSGTLKTQAEKKKKPAKTPLKSVKGVEAEVEADGGAKEPVPASPPRRRSSKFNPTAVTKPVKKKPAVPRQKFKVPVGRRAASRQAGDEAPAPVAKPLTLPKGGFTPEQLRKVKTGISAKQLANFRETLLQHRRELLADVAGITAARGHDDGDSHVPLHMADVGSENYEREFNLMLQETEHKLLVDIDAALRRIDDGTYGVCLDTCTPIGRGRLEYKPWARYGIDAARRREAASPRPTSGS